MTAVDISSVSSLFETHRVILSEPYMIAEPGDLAQIAETEAEAEWVKNYIPPGEEPIEPISDIYYPILEEALDSANLFEDSSYVPNNETFKGIFSMSIYWRDLMKEILPPGSDGIVVVFENECAPSFSYQINGPNVVFMGAGDLHDSEYDNLEVSSKILDVRKFANKDSTYSGIPVNENFCPFVLHVFPSDTKRDQHKSNEPYLFAICAVIIFIFTAAVFLLYDFWVERRQRLVMNTAIRSTAIVSSLYPTSVRERLYTESQDKQATKKRSLFGLDQERTLVSPFQGMVPERVESAPIADLFADCTVFFGDIA